MTNSQAQPVLELKSATIKFGGITAVNEFDMAIPKGMIAGLIGPNGAGKTTAFNIVTGFYKPTSGTVKFHGKTVNGGKDVHSLAPHQICESGIARTFQNIRLFHTQTALNNVMVGANIRQKGKWWMAPMLLPMYYSEQRRIRDYSMALLERLGLAAVANEPAAALPYGAQRRLEIARALATKPNLLLLDEPAAGMNPQESERLMDLIRQIRDDFDLTILLIEHDMKVVMGVCAHIWVLEYGLCIANGNPDSIRNNPKVIEAYLGEEFLKHA